MLAFRQQLAGWPVSQISKAARKMNFLCLLPPKFALQDVQTVTMFSISLFLHFLKEI